MLGALGFGGMLLRLRRPAQRKVPAVKAPRQRSVGGNILDRFASLRGLRTLAARADKPLPVSPPAAPVPALAPAVTGAASKLLPPELVPVPRPAARADRQAFVDGDDEAELTGSHALARARRRECERITAILRSDEAAGRADAAGFIALHTRIPRADAISLLAMLPKARFFAPPNRP